MLDATAANDAITSAQGPKKWGRWVHWYRALVALPIIVHSLADAYGPATLARMEPALTDLVGTLRFVGIRISNPGFDGPLGQQFYVNPIGIATWGVVLCTVTTLLYALRGSAPIGDPEAAVHMLIRARSWSSRRAWISIRARLLLVLVPLIALCVALFLDSALGWVVFHMRRRSGTRRRLDGWNASHPYRPQMRLPAPEPKVASRQ